MDDRQEKSDTAANSNGRDNADLDEELAARFPRPEEIVMPRGSDLPEPPKAAYQRPNLRRDTDPLPEGSNSVLAAVGQRSRNLRSLGVGGTIGISLVVSIGVGTGFGWLADKYLLHSTQMPWGLIVGFMVGVGSGFYNLIRVTNQLNEESE